MKKLICPVSPEKVNENVVRMTAFWVVMLSLVFIYKPNIYIPLFLAIDFYIRGFTKLKFSPLSLFSTELVKRSKLDRVLIPKAPKVFAARIGLLLSVLVFTFSLFNIEIVAISIASVLVLFAFLECGLNFCAGCWVYTYLVLPLYKNN